MKFAIFTALCLPLIALARGHETGNGGGAWVCRETSGAVRWVETLDLFEAREEMKLNPLPQSGDYRSIVNKMLKRTYKASIVLARALPGIMAGLEYLTPHGTDIIYTHQILASTEDAHYRVRPPVETCSSGRLVSNPVDGLPMVPDEQVVNYKFDRTILLQSDLWAAMNDVNKAAMVIHEAVYLYLREHSHDQDSTRTREIVGSIFSDISQDELRFAIYKTLHDKP